MKTNKVVYFAHGKESGPNGTKIQVLSDIATRKGYEVMSPDYAGMDSPKDRVEKLISLAQNSENLILAGSSMGSYVSTIASRTLRPHGLFLMAPAFLIDDHEYEEKTPKPYAKFIDVIHGWNDEIISVDKIIRYCQLYKVNLHLVDSDHRLKSKLDEIENLFKLFLEKFD